MKILLFGANGKVGSELAERLPKDGHDVVKLTRDDGDLGNPFVADALIKYDEPECVINATAYNGLEACVKDPERAFTINSAVPAHMAVACSKLNALFIHYSTDYVLGGSELALPMNESYPPKPWGIYGFTKKAGEDAALAFNCKTLVFRLSSIYGRTFSGPIDAVNQVRQGKGALNNPVKVLHQFCCPTSARLVADATAKVLDIVATTKIVEVGIYHLSTSTPVWKKALSEYLMNCIGDQTSVVQEGELPIPRPIYTVFNVDKFCTTFKYQLPGWKTDLVDTLPLIT